MLRVSFVERVDFTSGWDLDLRMGEDEFTKRLWDQHRVLCNGYLVVELTSSNVKPSTPCPHDKTKLQDEPYLSSQSFCTRWGISS
jgi:hypothetical protein